MDYKAIHQVEINDVEIVIYEYEEAEFGERYMGIYSPKHPVSKDDSKIVYAYNYEDIDENIEHILYTDDYSVVMAFFGSAVAKEAKALHEEEFSKIGSNVFTAEQCIPIDEETELFGKIVVLNSEGTSLTAQWQIRLVVIDGHDILKCAKISDGMRQNMPRTAIIGILRPDCYPDWVTERLKCITEGKQRVSHWRK